MHSTTPFIVALLPVIVKAASESTTLSAEALAHLEFELTEIMRLDQIHRTPVSWGTTDPEELERLEALEDDAHLAEWARRNREGICLPEAQEKELMRRQGVLDAANLVRLVTLMETYGYPNPERFGIEAPDPLPILIHATPEGYDAVAAQLLEEARAGHFRARSYAALFDRKRQHRGEMQLYGTCCMMDRATGKVLPPEIVSLEATNRARAEIGLDPLTDYTIQKVAADSGK